MSSIWSELTSVDHFREEPPDDVQGAARRGQVDVRGVGHEGQGLDHHEGEGDHEAGQADGGRAEHQRREGVGGRVVGHGLKQQTVSNIELI